MSYIAVCYNEGCNGTEAFEHPKPVMWICDDCRKKSKFPEPIVNQQPVGTILVSPETKAAFEEAYNPPPMSLEQAKTVAQQAAKRLAGCTRKEVVNDVWAAAVNKIAQDEVMQFYNWLTQRKELFICRLNEDERVMLVAEETRDDLLNEFLAYRKPE